MLCRPDRIVLASLAVLVLSGAASAQTGQIERHAPEAPPPPAADSTRINYGRITLVAMGPAIAVVGGYAYIKASYWSDQTTGFHFHQGNDFRYALNLDKVGHFYAGAFFSDLSASGLRWSGLSENDSYLYGAVLSSLIQLGFEIKDGYAPTWGFSPWDVAAGAVGSFYAMGRRHSNLLEATRVKMGYARRSESYWEQKEHPQIVDDYINQTYWLSFDVNRLLPADLDPYWPDFLHLAVGIGIDERTDGTGGGNRELYLGLDYSLRSLFPEPRSRLARAILSLLDYIKMPAPAVQLTPGTRLYGLYW
jgi:hypothetical protein